MKNAFTIFFKSLELYFSNFLNFFRYMAFPVFGQIFGLIWICIASYAYISFLPKMMQTEVFNNFATIFLVLFLITLPGLFILLKAFWDYLVAYGAVNSMLDGLIKSGTVYDFPAHNEVITRKTAKFIGLWLAISLLTLVAIFPLFWIFGAVLFIYFILVFQVFVFEPDESIIGCFKRSFALIKGKFLHTFVLMLLIGGLSMWALPAMITKISESLKVIYFLAIPLDGFASLLPLEEINKHLPNHLNSLIVAQGMVSSFISFIIVGITLPLRTICWGLWYKDNMKQKTSKKSKEK